MPAAEPSGPLPEPLPGPPGPFPGPPPVVPGYELEMLLGRGGSGEVWRAVPRGGGGPVAVKVLVTGDPEWQAREAALLVELDHPHLVRLHDVVRQPVRGGPPRVALVLDLLGGGSLAALLHRRGRLRPGEVVTAIAPIAAALAHAHQHGVVHGDLSPGNIVFTAEGRPVLTDLGVARVLGESGRAEVTPAYVDPTVARGGAPGPASDVFGVAAAAFHALTGIAPWNAAGPADTLAVAAAGQLPDLHELASGAPAELLAVIERGLADAPHERGSAAAFALDLRHACRPEPVRLPVSGVPDERLGDTGRGPRTELTHQVPGRRPRAVHAAPAPAGRWPHRRRRRGEVPDGGGSGAGLRAVLRRVILAAVATTGLAAAVWVGVLWGASAPRPGTTPAAGTADAAAAHPPASATASTPEPAPDAAPPATSPVPAERPTEPPAEAVEPLEELPAPGDLGDRPEPPADHAGWAALVEELYRRRAAAFSAGSPEAFTQVYTADSAQLTADRAAAAALADAGEVLRGFLPEVGEVRTARVEGERAELRLVDRWSAYEVVDAQSPGGATLRAVPGRAAAEVRLLLRRTDGGWRIESAQRLS